MDNLPIVRDKNALQALFQENKAEISKVLPKHISPESIMKQALNAAINNPALWRCTKESWIQSLMRAGELGLDCSGTLGQAYIIPYGNNATFMVGYRGMVDLVRRTGKVSAIDVHPVYEKDKFKCVFGTNPILEHEPYLQGNRGKVVCFYMVATLIDGSKQIEVMTQEEVDAIKARSKAKDSGPWKTDPVEMGRKTCFRRGFKWLPSSPELEKAVQYDDEATGIDMSNTIEIKAEPGVSGLVKALKGKAKDEPNTEPAKEPEQKEAPKTEMEETPPTPIETPDIERMAPSDFQRIINYCVKHSLDIKLVEKEICNQIGYEKFLDIPKDKGKQINKILTDCTKNMDYKAVDNGRKEDSTPEVK